jgi:hypothetical protein
VRRQALEAPLLLRVERALVGVGIVAAHHERAGSVVAVPGWRSTSSRPCSL